MNEVLYRVQNMGDAVYLETFKILKRTKCGAWIEFWGAPSKKFVNLVAAKQYASETKEEALEQFKIRKKWQRKHLLRSLEDINKILDKISKDELQVHSSFWESVYDAFKE